MAVAEPVVVGIKELMAERARRRSWCGASTTTCVLVTSWSVVSLGAELPRALKNDLDPESPPGDFLGPHVLAEAQAPLTDREYAFAGADPSIPAAVNRVEHEQVGGRRGAPLELVDVDDLKFRPTPGGSHGEPCPCVRTR